MSSTAGLSGDSAERDRENNELSTPDDYWAYLEKAFTFYGTIASQNTTDPAAQLEIGKAYWRMGDIQKQLGLQEEAKETYRVAGESWDKLRNDFRDAPEARHGLVDAYHWRAQIALNIKEYDQALALYAKILELAPGNAEAYCGRRHVHFNLGQFDDAIAEVSQAIELNPSEPLIWSSRASTYRKLKRWDDAFADYAKALELNPRHVETLKSRSGLYVERGEFAKAVADCNQAVAYARDDKTVWLNRALAYMRFGQYDEAVTDCSKAIELGADSALSFYWRALAQLASGQIGEYRSGAAEMLDRFGQSEDPNAAHWMAWTCSLVPNAVSDGSPVVEAAEKVASGESKSVQHLGTLGAALYRSGRFEDAVTCLTEVKDLIGDVDSAQPSSPAYTWFYLAMAHHRLGRAEEASQWLVKAIQWTERVLDEHDSGAGAKLPWNRRLTLRLFRAQAESLLETAGETVDLAKVMERFGTEAVGDVPDASPRQVRHMYRQHRLVRWLADEGRSDEAEEHFRHALSTFQNLPPESQLEVAGRLPKCGEAVVLPLPDVREVSYKTLITGNDLARLLPDASRTRDADQTFHQALALHQFKGQPEIVGPEWELTRIVFLRGCLAAHYKPRDGRLYVGTRDTDSDRLYAIDVDGRITRIADADRVAAVAVHSEDGHIFVSEDYGGDIYRTAFGTTGRETWVSGFKVSDSDPVGMAFATRDYVGKLLAPGEGLVVDWGFRHVRDEIYRFSATTPEQEVLLHSDGGNEGPLGLTPLT